MSATAEDGAALQQFCLLAKSAKGAACASLIGQALEHPGIFVFGELLDMPSVKEVRANSISAAPYRRTTRPKHTLRPSHYSSRARPRRRISSYLSSLRGVRGPTTKARARAPRRIVLTHHACALRVHRVHTRCPSCCPCSPAAPATPVARCTLHAACYTLRAPPAPVCGAVQAAQLPVLSEAQASKLKMLSVVTLSTKSKLISYDELMREIEARS